VPTQTSSVQVAAGATLPVVFDFGANQGDPDLFGAPLPGNTAGGSYNPSGGTVQPGVWFANPSEIGPYPVGGAPPGFVTMVMTASINQFDPAVTTAGGDLWLVATQGLSYLAGFAPVTINSGQTTTINVTITPSGASGTVVSGVLYVDDLVAAVPPYSQLTGDQLAAIPYTYTIK
jgi:hypothetical protein